MGVDRTDYIIFGFKFSPKDLKQHGIDLWDDKYLPYIEGHQGVEYIIVNDGMSGEYVVFGKLINQADENEGSNFKKIEYDSFFSDQVNKAIIYKFKELFGNEMYASIEDIDPQLLVFSHYS